MTPPESSSSTPPHRPSPLDWGADRPRQPLPAPSPARLGKPGRRARTDDADLGSLLAHFSEQLTETTRVMVGFGHDIVRLGALVQSGIDQRRSSDDDMATDLANLTAAIDDLRVEADRSTRTGGSTTPQAQATLARLARRIDVFDARADERQQALASEISTRLDALFSDLLSVLSQELNETYEQTGIERAELSAKLERLSERVEQASADVVLAARRNVTKAIAEFRGRQDEIGAALAALSSEVAGLKKRLPPVEPDRSGPPRKRTTGATSNSARRSRPTPPS